MTGSKGAGNGRVLQLADSGTKLAIGRDRGLYHVYRLHTFYDDESTVNQGWKLEKEIVVEPSDSSNVGDSMELSADDNTVLVDVGVNLMHLYNVTMGSLPDGYTSWPTCSRSNDVDNDGVVNDTDDCPGQGGEVDGRNGCPKDTDEDGIKVCALRPSGYHSFPFFSLIKYATFPSLSMHLSSSSQFPRIVFPLWTIQVVVVDT